ncbi:MAG: SBBP repeat-containing protein [Verrucomicrobiota bacterium]
MKLFRWKSVLRGAAALALLATTARGSTPAPSPLDISPLFFETNTAAEPASPFVAQGRDCQLLLSPTEAVYLFGQRAELLSTESLGRVSLNTWGPLQTRRLSVRLLNASPEATLSGTGPTLGRANHYIGNDPALWRAGVPLFSGVQVRSVYPGIDLTYHADNSARLEYDFILAPGARPDRIALQFDGADSVTVDAQGNLVLKIGDDQVRQHRPEIYQVRGGKRIAIPGGYRLLGPNTAGFKVGNYDASRPLVIDPVVTFADYIGGKKKDQAWAVAADTAGNVYVVGETLSLDLATTANALQTNYQGGHSGFGDGFVARFQGGTNLDYLTYLGGKQQEAAFAVAVDKNDNSVFVTGYTDSTNFPITPGAFQTKPGGTNLNARLIYPLDAFVTKLSSSGTLVYSTYIGGIKRDVGLGIAVDNLDRAYVTGLSESSNYVDASGISNFVKGYYVYGKNSQTRSNYQGNIYHQNGDAFVARLNAAGSAMEYYSFLGGSNQDIGQGIAVDSAYCAYVVGFTSSTNFPTTNVFTSPLTNLFALQPSSFLNNQSNHSFYADGFLCKVASDGLSLEYSSYIGGSNQDQALAVAVDPSYNAYVTGFTFSTNFPVTDASTNFDRWTTNKPVNCDVFVTKFSPDGQIATNGGYSLTFGGKGADQGYGIAVDDAGNAYITGGTSSRSNFAGIYYMTNFFPSTNTSTVSNTLYSMIATNGFSPTNSTPKSKGTNDAFIVVLDTSGSNLFSAFYGGRNNETATGIALDPSASPNMLVYIVGYTTTTNLPGAATNAWPGPINNNWNGFVTRMSFP